MTDAQSEINKSKLLYQLCSHLARPKSESDLLRIYKLVSGIASSSASEKSSRQHDELLIGERIRKKIACACGKEDALLFADIHRKLKSTGILRNRPEILSFLLTVSNLPEIQQGDSAISIEKALVDVASKQTMTSAISSLDSLPLLAKDSSWENNWENNNSSGNGGRPQTLSYHNPRTVWKEARTPNVFMSTAISSPEYKLPLTLSAYQHAVSETTLLQDLIYCFQGISGKVLRLDPITNSFFVDPMVQMKRPRRRVVLQLAELGWLHNRLRALSDNLKQRSQQLGLMAQSLAYAVNDELAEFYRLLAVMQSQLQMQLEKPTESPLSDGASRASGGSQQSHPSSLTLRQMQVHVAAPHERLRWLVALCEACQEKRGGALASAVHCFLDHADPSVRVTVRYLLAAVCKPLYSMLSRWILDGELEDPYNEFFIQTNMHESSNDQLWHDKYKVRESMVPSFISMDQARKILATGKSINFLRQVCQDHSPVNGREVLCLALEKSSVEAVFPTERDSDLHCMMDNTYLEVSRRVLDVLNTKYKFMEHMQALRRYLLLGQGDFIRHFMDVLEPELRKPASEVYTHNLTGILDSAIRATNAQFEDESILQRLDVRLLEQSPGDTGWDIFSLEYHVDGPIGTVFSACTMSYLTLFNSLWRAKRTEWILSKMWKRLTTSAKLLPRIPELSSLLHQTYLLSGEMIHLVHQLQYYFLFEVMECSWAKLISCVQQADGLDDIIRAHDTFLDRIKAGALVDDSSQELASHLRTVYDIVVRLQILEDKLHNRVVREMQRRAEYEKLVEEEGTNNERELENQKAQSEFKDAFLATTHVNLRVLAQSYEDVVKKFLLQLASHSDMSLQLLSSRLDFNEHYKRRDSRLTAPLTYQHRRREVRYTTSESFC